MSDEPAPTIAAPPPGLWSRVCRGEMRCVAELAARFWLPVYVWLRAHGDPAEQALKHSGDLFSTLSSAEPPVRDDPDAARFREFVITRLRAFLAAGFPKPGSSIHIEMDAARAERCFAAEPQKTEDEVFERRWSLQVLEATMRALRAEYSDPEKARLFDVMKPFLAFNADEQGYSEAAKAVAMSGSALHLQVFNFRKRYRSLLRAQIADTVRHSDDVDSELTVLLVAAS